MQCGDFHIHYIYIPMSSVIKRPRREGLAAVSLPGNNPRQPTQSVQAVASRTSEGRTCQPMASPLGRVAGTPDTHSDLLADLKTCAQVLQ